MDEIILNYKKEYNNFQKRSYMKKWLFKLFLMLVLFTFFELGTISPYTFILDKLNVAPQLKGAVFNLFLMSFIIILIPNNATLDTILGEKKNKTIETLMTMPMSISNVFIGKMLFIMFLVFSQFTLYFISSNLIMYFTHEYTFFTYINNYAIILYIISMTCTIMVCTLVGVIFSLINNNVKAIGYLNTIIGLALILISLQYVSIQISIRGLVKVLFIQILIILSLLVFLSKYIKRSTVMKYVK